MNFLIRLKGTCRYVLMVALDEGTLNFIGEAKQLFDQLGEEAEEMSRPHAIPWVVHDMGCQNAKDLTHGYRVVDEFPQENLKRRPDEPVESTFHIDAEGFWWTSRFEGGSPADLETEKVSWPALSEELVALKDVN